MPLIQLFVPHQHHSPLIVGIVEHMKNLNPADLIEVCIHSSSMIRPCTNREILTLAQPLPKGPDDIPPALKTHWRKIAVTMIAMAHMSAADAAERWATIIGEDAAELMREAHRDYHEMRSNHRSITTHHRLGDEP